MEIVQNTIKDFLIQSIKLLKIFICENIYPLIIMLLLFAKGLFFAYTVNILPSFPAILRPIVVSFAIYLVLFLPILLLKKNKYLFSLAVDMIVSLILIIDLLYIRFFSSFPTVTLFAHVGNVGEALPSAISALLRPTDIIFVIDIVLIFFLARKVNISDIKIFKMEKVANKNRKLVNILLITAILTMVMGIGIIEKNGFWKEANSNVTSNMVVFEKYGFMGAHFFDIYRNIKSANVKISDEEKKTIINETKAIVNKPADNDFTGLAKNKNIILIQVESFQSFYLDKTIDGQEITPNINKLLRESHYFDNNYFEIGAGGTSDIDFVANTSFFPLSEKSVFINYAKNTFSSLGNELKNIDYGTFAYHANERGFWNRETVLKSLGYDKYYAADNYPKGKKYGMGLSDSEFLAKTADYIAEQNKPSFHYVITLTSHYPYDLAQEDKMLKLKNSYPEVSANYFQTVRYTDQAIGQFIDKLKAKNLYDDSLIVIYGDHSARLTDFTFDGNNYVSTDFNNKKVPLIIKTPRQKVGFVHKEVSSTIDIMPTILNLAGVKSTMPMFGRDLFGNAKPFFSSLYYFAVLPSGSSLVSI